MVGVFEWSTLAASNGTADADINWAEGNPAVGVNNNARAMMQKVRLWSDILCGALSTAGSAAAFTLTTGTSLTLRAGVVVGFKADRSGTGSDTLNVDGTGAKQCRGSPILAGGYHLAFYNAAAGHWFVTNMDQLPLMSDGGRLDYVSASQIKLTAVKHGRMVANLSSVVVPPAGITLASTSFAVPTTVSARALTSNVVTLTTSTAHGLTTGQKVLVYNVKDTYNGTRVVTSTPTSTTFTFALTAANEGTVSGLTGTVYPFYYIYAQDANSDGVLDTLTGSATAYSLDVLGNPYQTGDATKALVGVVVTAAAGFADSDAHRGVRTYFNRSRVRLKNKLSAQGQTAVTTYVELDAAGRIIWAQFANEPVVLDSIGYTTGAGNLNASAIGIDTVVEGDSGSRTGASTTSPIGAIYRSASLSENPHCANLYGSSSSGTALWGPAAETAVTHFVSIDGFLG